MPRKKPKKSPALYNGLLTDQDPFLNNPTKNDHISWGVNLALGGLGPLDPGSFRAKGP